ncbi:MAG: excinuclease ABC subunit UvrC [Microthrixaceae bacterium]
MERQQMVADTNESFDVIGIEEDELEASVQVFLVRRGRVVGRSGFLLDKVLDLSAGETVSAAMEHLYGDEPAMGWPKMVLMPTLPDDPDLYRAWLAEMRGTNVELRVPRRGPKRQLADTVHQNAAEALTRHRLRRASDHNTRARALNELETALELPDAPLRIECYDMSHLQGTDYVGSMVVLEDGLPRKSEYRKFRIKGVEGNDDFAAMREVLHRRLSAYLADRDLPAAERGKFSYPPQLLLVDGGKGQLGVATGVLEELGLTEQIPVASLAKRFEQVYLPGRQDPVEVPRGSEALFMLQRIRDESHRFAISYHRQLRGKRMLLSELDDVTGLGPRRRERLIEHFGSVPKLRSAALEDLLALSWLPSDVAEAVYERLHGTSS